MNKIKLNLEKYSFDAKKVKKNRDLKYIRPNYRYGLSSVSVKEENVLTEEKRTLIQSLVGNLDSVIIDKKTFKALNEIADGVKTEL